MATDELETNYLSDMVTDKSGTSSFPGLRFQAMLNLVQKHLHAPAARDECFAQMLKKALSVMSAHLSAPPAPLQSAKLVSEDHPVFLALATMADFVT